ncbi:T6SS immunity protein Tli3 family protein [Gilliamella sp. wkB308]|uniref:T6SS immunity protein Tli3 family protein n=1 Tax=Gilliamella sp. wkB308 TaxID=3120263 RepID=UPI00080E8410|nr:hypothetical protein [Gilliamella apicola]OCF94687.1 hypothetical protein A9G10_01560 [Gilliamella apicola]OCF96732.1 hypothetical protein A9G10_07650 [Gilliamella apicola]OCF98187.1 hypothetical protein A9G10_06635 [Gilliamella apicola]OCF99936.1 hypothetical protein A9G10_04885 [Gilliamella apicola]
MIILAILLTLIGGISFSWLSIKRHHLGWQVLSYLIYIFSILAISPITDLQEQKYVSPSQIVYRFDENRYLLLTGYRCNGQVYFIDDKEQVYYRLAAHSQRIYTEPYRHPAKNYISVPLSDLSAIDISIDGGRSFRSIHLANRYWLGNHDSPQYDVVNDQAFILAKDGNVHASERPFGTKAPHMLSKWDQHKKILGRSQIIPDTIPPIPDDYTGWDKMQCDFDADEVKLPNNLSLLTVFQQWLGTAKSGTYQ